jgi:hypothetical protein
MEMQAHGTCSACGVSRKPKYHVDLGSAKSCGRHLRFVPLRCSILASIQGTRLWPAAGRCFYRRSRQHYANNWKHIRKPVHGRAEVQAPLWNPNSLRSIEQPAGDFDGHGTGMGPPGRPRWCSRSKIDLRNLAHLRQGGRGTSSFTSTPNWPCFAPPPMA